ncbi:hypothetical protein QR680_003784 [Steinernema hermaphroditum]|uniref:UDP-glucuronosyltransferase n=1 Tax=Steinernema hermaphroditum TaxID=289476 RepID=A0AA39HMK2_9BILA|nr:hypothetical protein QR680_003784 [Steinernema hermaphroditum]
MSSVWLLLWFVAATSASEILFVNMWNSKSHAGTMHPLAERLAKHGHNVTMYTQVLSSIGKLRGVNTVETVLPERYNRESFADTLNNLIWKQEFVPDTVNEAYKIGQAFTTDSWSEETFQSIRNRRYDLVVSDEMFTNTGFGLALEQNYLFGSKIALFTTTDLFPTYSRMRALSRNPVMAPNYYTRTDRCYAYSPRNFYDRLLTIRDVVSEFASLEYISEFYMRQSVSRFGVHNFHWNDLYSKTEITFSDYPDRYAWPTAVSNQMVYTGSYCNGAGRVHGDLEAFMNDTTKKGVIYVAFGSMVNWGGAPVEVIDAFFDMFTYFPDYNFIFSFKLKGYPVKEKAGPNVKVLSWAPQREIVADERTVLFFTHGGLKSLKESICAGTPVLVLPFFADQVRNALYMVHLGFAEYVNKRTITLENLVEPMGKMLSQRRRYKENILRVRSMFVDRIMDPLEEGAFWTDKMLRSERRINFEIMGTELSYFKIFNFDLLLLLAFVSLILIC